MMTRLFSNGQPCLGKISACGKIEQGYIKTERGIGMKQEHCFKVGDVVEIVEMDTKWKFSHGEYTFLLGDEKLQIKTQDPNKAFTVLPDEKQKFKIGDMVRIINDNHHHPAGLVGKIAAFTEDEWLEIEDDDADHWYAKPEDVEPVVAKEVKREFKVGDRVKIVGMDTERDKEFLGTTGRIDCKQNCPSYPYWVMLDHGVGHGFSAKCLELVEEKSNTYHFIAKPSEVDLARIWKEANPDFAVVIDFSEKLKYVYVLVKNPNRDSGYDTRSCDRGKEHELIEKIKKEREAEQKHKVSVTIY